MSWNCPRCFRSNSEHHGACRGCGAANPAPARAAAPTAGSGAPNPIAPVSPPGGPAGPHAGGGAHHTPARFPWPRCLQLSGEVLSVAETSVPRPTDPYRVLTLLIILGIGSALALPLVIGILVALAVLSIMMPLVGFRSLSGLSGCSPFLLHLLLARGTQRAQQQVPKLCIRLRDRAGTAVETVTVGFVPWPAPAVGDRVEVSGSFCRGVFKVSGGRNLTSGSDLRVPGSPWRIAFLVLLSGIGILALIVGLSAPDGGRPPG